MATEGMSKRDREILDQFAQTLVPELRAIAGESFGKTIESEVTDTSLTITASPYIAVLWKGRGPTGSGARRGSPTLQEVILGWIQRKNIQPQPTVSGRVMSIEQLSWAMSKSIHIRGTLLYRQGGKPNIFDPIITEQRIDSLLSLFGERYLNSVTTTVLDNLKAA